jgi:anti-sigma B factor antagonist
MSLLPDCLLLDKGHPEAARLDLERLSEVDIERVRGRLWEWMAGRRGQDLHLDLGKLEYMTSTGLGLFLSLHQEVREFGGRLHLLNVREPIYELFALTRLDGILDVRRPGAA